MLLEAVKGEKVDKVKKLQSNNLKNRMEIKDFVFLCGLKILIVLHQGLQISNGQNVAMITLSIKLR